MFYLIFSEYAKTLQRAERHFVLRFFLVTNIEHFHCFPPTTHLHRTDCSHYLPVPASEISRYFNRALEGRGPVMDSFLYIRVLYICHRQHGTNKPTESIDSNVSINWLLDWIKTNLSVWFWFIFLISRGHTFPQISDAMIMPGSLPPNSVGFPQSFMYSNVTDLS